MEAGHHDSTLGFRNNDAASLQAGDIAFFNYKGDRGSSFRQVLVVNTEVSKNGKWRSMRGNNLINCFEVYGSTSKLDLLFTYFYKNRIGSSYKKGLNLFFGESKFRTFNLNKIGTVYELVPRKVISGR